MKRNQLVVMAGLIGLVGVAAGCRDTQARSDIAKIDAYLADEYSWQLKLYDAHCAMESVVLVPPVGDGVRICASTGPGDVLPPPKYPKP